MYNAFLVKVFNKKTWNDDSKRLIDAADDARFIDGTAALMPERELNLKIMPRSLGTEPFKIFHI